MITDTFASSNIISSWIYNRYPYIFLFQIYTVILMENKCSYFILIVGYRGQKVITVYSTTFTQNLQKRFSLTTTGGGVLTSSYLNLLIFSFVRIDLSNFLKGNIKYG